MGWTVDILKDTSRTLTLSKPAWKDSSLLLENIPIQYREVSFCWTKQTLNTGLKLVQGFLSQIWLKTLRKSVTPPSHALRLGKVHPVGRYITGLYGPALSLVAVPFFPQIDPYEASSQTRTTYWVRFSCAGKLRIYRRLYLGSSTLGVARPFSQNACLTSRCSQSHWQHKHVHTCLTCSILYHAAYTYT